MGSLAQPVRGVGRAGNGLSEKWGQSRLFGKNRGQSNLPGQHKSGLASGDAGAQAHDSVPTFGAKPYSDPTFPDPNLPKQPQGKLMGVQLYFLCRVKRAGAFLFSLASMRSANMPASVDPSASGSVSCIR